MIRRNVFLTPAQIEFLKTFKELSVSEHIRRAVDLYINRLQKTNVAVSSSKGGN